MLLSSGDAAWTGTHDISPDVHDHRDHRAVEIEETTEVVAPVSTINRLPQSRTRHEHRANIYTAAPAVDAGDAGGAIAISTAEAYAYCQRIARAIARTFYYGSLFLPPEKRRASWALYAFCRTADDIADEPALFPDPLAELARWRTALENVYAGLPSGPVMTAWADMLRRFAVPIEPALDLLAGVDMDVRGQHYDSFDDLRLYCYRVAGTVGLLMSPILGYDDPAALDAAVDLGIAMQLTNILRDVGEDLANGRIYLPVEDMLQSGYSEDELRSGVVNDAFVKLIEKQMARAEKYYARGMRGIALLRPESRLAIALSGRLYAGILTRIRRNDYDVFSRRAHISTVGKLAALPGVWLGLRRMR